MNKKALMTAYNYLKRKHGRDEARVNRALSYAMRKGKWEWVVVGEVLRVKGTPKKKGQPAPGHTVTPTSCTCVDHVGIWHEEPEKRLKGREWCKHRILFAMLNIVRLMMEPLEAAA